LDHHLFCQALAFLPELQGLSQPGIIISNAAISACAKGWGRSTQHQWIDSKDLEETPVFGGKVSNGFLSFSQSSDTKELR
jgi:hypothetical protein